MQGQLQIWTEHSHTAPWSKKWGFRVENDLGWKLYNFFYLFKGLLFIVGLRNSVGRATVSL